MMTGNRAPWTVVFPLLVAILAVGWQTFGKEMPPPHSDAVLYVTVASNLVRHGTFTNGRMDPVPDPDRPGRFLTPAYPVLLAALAKVDPRVGPAIDCVARGGKGCPGSLQSVMYLQSILNGVVIFLIFLIALRLSNSLAVAWLALALASASGVGSDFVQVAVNYPLAHACFFAFSYFSIRAVDEDRGFAALMAGLALGLAILTRPAYLYLFYLAVPALFIVMYLVQKRMLTNALLSCALFAGGTTVLVAPWMLRNYVQFGDVALTSDYGAIVFAERLGYNDLRWDEVGAASIRWLPGIGEPLARQLFSPELLSRIGTSTYDDHEPLHVFKGELYERTLEAAGGPDRHLTYLLRVYVLGDFSKHMVLTLLLTLRGMWVGKYLAFAGLLLMLPASWVMSRRNRIVPFLVFVLPLLFMSFFHGFVSSSAMKYHIPLIGLYSFVCALVLVSAISAILRRIGGRPG